MYRMKHTLIMAAAALVLAACSQDEPAGDSLPGGKRPLVINASGLQAIATPQTRGTLDGNWDGVNAVAVMVDEGGIQDVKEYKVEAEADNDKARLTPATDLSDSDEDALFWWTSTTQTKTVNAWCPYNNGQFPSLWEVPIEQTAENMQAADLLFARQEGMTLQESETETFGFQHKLSKVRINLKATEYLKNAAKVDVQLLDQYTMASFDNLTQPLSGIGGRSKAITPCQLETPESDCYASYEALVIPFTADDKDKTDELIGITVDGAEYIYHLPGGYNDDLFRQGQVYIFTITVKEQGLEDVSIEQSIEWSTGNPSSGNILLEDGYDATTNTYYAYTAKGLEDWAKDVRENNNLDAKCLLFNDIDFKGGEWTPVGTYSSGTRFSGTFDGQGHTISNMKIAEGGYAGMFGYIEEKGQVQNVKFKDIEIPLNANNQYVGVVAGYNDGIISHCRITDGTASINNANGSIGGIAGQNNGTISCCEVTECNVYNISGIAGGIAGENHGQIEACSFTDKIFADIYGGGIVGMNSGDIKACWTDVAFAGNGIKGGVCGMLNSGIITACYWDSSRSGINGIGYNPGSITDDTYKVDGNPYTWIVAADFMNYELSSDLGWHWLTSDPSTPPTLVPNN